MKGKRGLQRLLNAARYSADGLAAETLAFIQTTNKEIYNQMDKALDKIERSMRRIPQVKRKGSHSEH